MGIERYVADFRTSGSERLFPCPLDVSGLPWNEEDGPGRAISRWANTHHLRRACCIRSDKEVTALLPPYFHYKARLPPSKSIIQTINGHSDGWGVDARTYVARDPLLECQRTLDRLEYPSLEVVPYVRVLDRRDQTFGRT